MSRSYESNNQELLDAVWVEYLMVHTKEDLGYDSEGSLSRLSDATGSSNP